MDILTEGGLALRVSPGKGRGVFALRPFKQGEVLATNAVLVFGEEDAKKLEDTALSYYHFSWPFTPDGKAIDVEATPYSALPFGLISIINHADEAASNATWNFAPDVMTIVAVATRDIAEGEEILWNYNWF